MTTYIKADRFLLEHGEAFHSFLEINNGRFGEFVNNVPNDAEIIDWTGYTVAPGLFDTHIHGIKNQDVMDGTAEAIHLISEAILALGVTRFLPTTLTSSKAALEASIQAIVNAVKDGLQGAQSEGIFLEGPYFTEQHKGAQNPSYFRDPDMQEFERWQELAEGSIVKIALAPERENSIPFIKQMRESRVLPSIAHTDASFECCQQAVAAGATNFVHLFNGMSGLHHRNPGVVGAALTNPHAFAELICDGFHVHPEVAAFAARVKEDKLQLITDCMRAGLMPDGNYQLGEFPVIMKQGVARTETGSLAGSTLTLIDGVKNLHAWSEKALYDVWHLASLSPAASLGRANELGSIAPGKLADYVVLNEQLDVQAVAVEGNLKYKRV
ncbi:MULTISPECIES: N-acetylglucosamine-6-phosphate deacetylase [unclassified Virgibacillus]|uniref:N-acetylglucosamine-6-phosphate deacetylase n=1 Tax=unclassified Virgibacillus TaxID=2620237 RepID=UPI0024DED25E|nr:N-acetylglucosamine-6-phosphate deacetylase [Virgibacillus sp. LDC-1]